MRMRKAGMTLVEMLFSITLLLIVVTAAYFALYAMNQTRANQEARIGARQQIRDLYLQLGQDFQGSVCLYGGYGGMFDGYSFASTPTPSAIAGASANGLLYAIPQLGLDNLTVNPQVMLYTLVGVWVAPQSPADPLNPSATMIVMRRLTGITAPVDANGLSRPARIDPSSLNPTGRVVKYYRASLEPPGGVVPNLFTMAPGAASLTFDATFTRAPSHGMGSMEHYQTTITMRAQ
jgi:prepilin-type N-terminal cleavage/methylation domain-containing protein